MAHSPSNSTDSTASQAVAILPSPFKEWVDNFTIEELTPRGSVPETETITRRSSLVGGNRITLRRDYIPIQFNNTDNHAQVGVVVMRLTPPSPPGGNDFQLLIPRTWWRSQLKHETKSFTSKHVREALASEVLNRVQGNASPQTLIRSYTKDLRHGLENCVKNLPATAFEFGSDEAGHAIIPEQTSCSNWIVSYGDQHPSGIDMHICRIVDTEVEVQVKLLVPFTVLSQSPSAISDWLLMQIAL